MHPRKIAIIIVLSITALLMGCASTPVTPGAKQALSKFKLGETSSLLYITRTDIFLGSAVTTKHYIDGQLVGYLGNGDGHIIVALNPGEHEFKYTGNLGLSGRFINKKFKIQASQKNTIQYQFNSSGQLLAFNQSQIAGTVLGNFTDLTKPIQLTRSQERSHQPLSSSRRDHPSISAARSARPARPLRPARPARTARPARIARPSPSAPLLSSQLPKTRSPNQGEIERVAVLELRNRIPKQVSTDEIGFLVNEMRAIASYLPHSHFLIMTKESMATLIDPNKSLEDCVGVCEVQTGRLLGAKWIITGDVVRFGSSLRVSLKLHNTKTGQFIKGGSVKGKQVEDLEEMLKLETLRLIIEMSPYLKQRLIEVAGEELKDQMRALLRGKVR